MQSVRLRVSSRTKAPTHRSHLEHFLTSKMGRRNRRNRHHDEDGDHGEEEEDAFEREWLRKRQKTAAAAHDDGSAAPETAKAPAPAPAPEESKSSADAAADEANGSGGDKVEKLRAKKQAQKQRRKEKKAAAAAKRKEQEVTLAEQQAQRNKDRAAKELQQKKQRQEREKDNRSQQHAFQTLRRGVQMRDIKIGKGPMVQHRKKCRVKYVLRSKSHISGKILDSSQNFAFRLGKGEVISGWDIGMQEMRVGGVRRLIVPPEAGYGNKDIGAGRGAVLYFEIELLHVAP